MRKGDKITFIIIFFIAIFSTIFFLKPHYSIDTVEFLTVGYESYINSKFLVDGRIFSVLLLKTVIDMPMQYVIPILYIIGILISCISVMYIRKWIITKVKLEEKDKIIPTIISYVLVFNFMYIDAFQFMEFPIIALSVLLNLIASGILVKKEKAYLIKSIAILMIAIFCYQGTITVCIITVFVMSIIENKKINKNVILNMLKLGLELILIIGINYCFTYCVGGTSRLYMDCNIVENFKNALIELYMILFNGGIHYYPLLQLIFILCIVEYCIIKKVKILNIILILILTIITSMIVIVPTNSRYISNTQYGRIMFIIGAMIGYILFYLWCTNEVIRNSKFIKTTVFIYFISIFTIYFQYTYMYMKGQEIDKYIIENINQIILKHEEKTGNNITKYAYSIDCDNYSIYESSNILNREYNKMNNVTILSGRRTKEYISEGLFKLYSNRKIDKVYRENWKEQYFSNMNFKQMELFDERRFVFIEDTVFFIL